MTTTIFDFDDKLVLDVLAFSKDATAVYISEDLHIRFANDVMLKFWDKGREIIGMPLGEAVPELQGQPFLDILKEVWRTGTTYKATDTPANLLVDGTPSVLYFDFQYRALLNEEGKTYCILHSATDVTRRLRAWQLVHEKEQRETQLIADLSDSNERLTTLNEAQEAANEELLSANEDLATAQEQLSVSNDKLTESENQIRNVFEQAPVGIAVLRGPDHIIEIANKAILNIWGRREQEVLNKPHKIARPELAGQSVYGWLDEVYQTGNKRVNNEIRIMLYDKGGLREAFVNSIYQPLRDAEGKVNGILVILEDLTDVIKVRREAARIQDMFNLAIEAGELGTFYYDPKTNSFTGNDLLKSWFGLNPEDEISLDAAIDVIAKSDRQKVIDAIQQTLRSEKYSNYAVEYTIINPLTQQSRIVRAKGKSRFDAHGNAISLNGTVQDITEPKRDEQRKNDFIAMVSHELKTPLTSLSGYIQILQKKATGSVDKAVPGILAKAHKQAVKMTTMINGFLNVSRLESGKISIERARVNMASLVREVEDGIVQDSLSHRIIFKPVQETWVNVDRDKIEQVINNFISNALKYSLPGTDIHVSCVIRNGHALVEVTDEGMGVSEADIPHLFDRFYRVQGKEMTSIAGFGIGLYLCKEIIERHEGEIGLISEPGKGSKFWFTLPVIK
ncbi:PAS domain-containing sensor histidine kinase [Mucilaginibacter sp. KACC 22063]|uniref:PAS domain-containing sensor histidine kinase n=1 Tax=Mucilaginibacter sp. KACC 22063 TaxID=3025666 RepID=UPI002366402F|nr:ATP-binding protein [Mucilaginibacter sp. KACC 22063]WDF53864.1 ATP-binding protein [Mucilaginibacter sp. KACC 22063]